MAKYEVKTMKKDIERLRKKVSISEPVAMGKKGAPPKKLPTPPAPAPAARVKKGKEKGKPGAPLPSEPIATAKWPEPVKPAEPKEPETKKPSRQRKNIFPIVILIIVILLIGGGVYYWWNYLRAPEKPEPETPVSLIGIERTEIIEIKEGEEAGLFEELKKKARGFQEQNTFRRILFKKVTEEKDYFLSFKEISEILGLNIPANISDNLGERHTLFLYAQTEENKLGAIVEISDSKNLIEYLESWEETMVEDLKPFFLGQEPGQPAAEEFQDNVYKDVNIRYLNFPDSSFSIDYTLIESYLIITTSRKNIYGVIDRAGE